MKNIYAYLRLLLVFFCLLGIQGTVYADGEWSDDDWGNDDTHWGDDTPWRSAHSWTGSDMDALQGIANGETVFSNYYDNISAMTVKEAIEIIAANIDLFHGEGGDPFYLGENGVFDIASFFIEKVSDEYKDKIIATETGIVVYSEQVYFNLKDDNATEIGGGNYVLTHLEVNRAPGENNRTGTLVNSEGQITGTYELTNGTTNPDGTITYSGAVIDPNPNIEDFDSGSFASYIGIENQLDVLDLGSDDEVYLPSNDDYEDVTDLFGDDENVVTDNTETVKKIPLEDIATEAEVKYNSSSQLKKYVVKPNGIVFEKPPYIGAPSTNLELTGSTVNKNSSAIKPQGYIVYAGLVIGTYQLTGEPSSSTYTNIKVWLDYEGPAGLDNLQVNISSAHQAELQSLVLPPQEGWSEDHADIVLVPEGIVLPGDSFERNIEITIANAINRAPNGKEKSGMVYDNNGVIVAKYSLLGEQINGDGTKSYDNLKIEAVTLLTPYEGLEFDLYPMVEANSNTYSYDLPDEAPVNHNGSSLPIEEISNPIFSNSDLLSPLLARDGNGNIVYITNGEIVRITHPSGYIAVMEKGFILSNNGTPIPVLRNADDADDCFDTNCHGLTFTEGSFWMNGESVDLLIFNDGYSEVTSLSDIHPGDVLIYIQLDTILHSVTVVQSNGTVEGLIVSGLGGIETEAKTEHFRNAWSGSYNGVVYRRESSDIILTEEEIEQKRQELYGN